MSDWLTLLAIFIAVLNPAATALIFTGVAGPRASGVQLARTMIPGFVVTILTLSLAALLSQRVLDWLDLSLSTFQIATGLLLAFGAFQAFVGRMFRYLPAPGRPGLWLNVAVLVWLLSPPPIALAIASSASEGRTRAILAASVATLAVAALALAATEWRYPRSGVVLAWAARALAAVVVVAAVDLIRQGVENV